MLIPDYTGQFRKDLRKAAHRGRNIAKLKDIITLLLEEKPLPFRLHDHSLKGEWKDCWELHIEPDWLLVYRIREGMCIFYRTGTHADIF